MGLDLVAKPVSSAIWKKLRELSTQNSDRASEVYREEMDEIIVELVSMYPAWDQVADSDRPSLGDLENALAELKHATNNSSGAPKRKMLLRAFFASFNPKYYESGLNRILWNYVEKLEYPDAVFLRKVYDQVISQIDEHTASAFHFPNGSHNTGFRSTEMQISRFDLEYEFARRLSYLDLVDLAENDDGTVNISPRLGLVKKLREFIWDLESETDS